jgi:hypothetical protein
VTALRVTGGYAKRTAGAIKTNAMTAALRTFWALRSIMRLSYERRGPKFYYSAPGEWLTAKARQKGRSTSFRAY